MAGTVDAVRAEIGVIGGSGLYAFLDGPVDEVEVDTPYGSPSDPVVIGSVAGRSVAGKIKGRFSFTIECFWTGTSLR